MDSFLKKFFPNVYKKMKEDKEISNYCKFDSQLLTSFTSSLYVAGLFASFVASWITKKFGRKPTILAGGAAFLTGAALGGAAFNVYMVIFGRVLLGIGVGFANQVGFISFHFFLFYFPLYFILLVLSGSKLTKLKASLLWTISNLHISILWSCFQHS